MYVIPSTVNLPLIKSKSKFHLKGQGNVFEVEFRTSGCQGVCAKGWGWGWVGGWVGVGGGGWVGVGGWGVGGGGGVGVGGDIMSKQIQFKVIQTRQAQAQKNCNLLLVTRQDSRFTNLGLNNVGNYSPKCDASLASLNVNVDNSYDEYANNHTLVGIYRQS